MILAVNLFWDFGNLLGLGLAGGLVVAVAEGGIAVGRGSEEGAADDSEISSTG